MIINRGKHNIVSKNMQYCLQDKLKIKVGKHCQGSGMPMQTTLTFAFSYMFYRMLQYGCHFK